jgi:hypothetical protein
MVLMEIPLLIAMIVLRRRAGHLRLSSPAILSRSVPCSQGRSRILGNGIIERDHRLRTNDAVWGEAFAFLETGNEFWCAGRRYRSAFAGRLAQAAC